MILLLVAAALLGGVLTASAEPTRWTGEPIAITQMTIQVDNPRQQEEGVDWQGLARDVIGLGEGNFLPPGALDAAVARLEAFGHVQTTVRSIAPQQVAIHFLLLPYQRIKSIDIKSVYPLFERDIRNLMTVAPGDIYDPGKILEQTDLIERRYKDEGYIAPQVKITWAHDPTDGHVEIYIQIQKGTAYQLGRLKLTGNRTMPDPIILGMMSTWRSFAVHLGTGRWAETRLKDDIKTILSYYRNQGFAQAKAVYEMNRHPEQGTVDVRIVIDEGPRYLIEFSGNRHFSDMALKKNLVVFTRGNRGNIGLRRSVQNIRRQYRKAGFADVRVKWEDVKTEVAPSDERKVRIVILEGERHIVRQVEIKGHQALTTDAIKAQLLTRPPNGFGKGPFARAVLQEDLSAVEALYRKNGYQDARVSDIVAIDPGTHQVTVTLAIDEGPRVKVGEVRIEGGGPISAKALKRELPLKPGDVYLPINVAENENSISARIAARGFPHVEVQTQVVVSEDRTRADLVHTIDSGPQVSIGRIFWAGNFRTRDKLMQRKIQLKKGEPFSLEKVLQAQRNLRDLDLFRSVQIRSIGLKERTENVHLLVTVVEKSPYFFELGIGYRTDKGVYERAKVGDRNFLGLNKEVRLSGELSGIGHRVDADLVEPDFLDTGIDADLGVFTERKEEFNQDFGTDITGCNFTFSRPWGNQLFTALTIRYERREQFLREGDAATLDIDPETLEPRTIWVTTPAVRYDSRNSFVRPREGQLASLAMDISKGLDSSLDNFIKYKLDLRAYHTPRQRLTLAGHCLAGYILSYGDEDKIPEDQLFFLGGTNDVRGFEENLLRFNADQDPVGGRISLAASVEARYALTQSWELTVFVDTGTIREELSGGEQSDEQWQWTSGLGLRYITPIGPIGLLYGHKLDPRPGESDGQFHFSIGYTF